MVFGTLKPSFEAWKKMYLAPKIAIPAECKKKAGLMEGTGHIVLGTTVLFAALAIVMLLLAILGAGKTGAFGAALGVVLLLIIVYYVIGLLSNFMGSFAMNGFYYVVASKLGGKGTYDRQFYVLSVETAATMMFMLAAFALVIALAIVLGILNAGALMLLALLPALAVYAYDAYLKIKILQSVHRLTFGKAFVVWGVPVLICIVFLAIYFGILIAATGLTMRNGY
jgi:hypothetical protein